MKITKQFQGILNGYLFKELTYEGFKEAMKDRKLTCKQNLQITDVFFRGIGSVDIIGLLIGQASINSRPAKGNEMRD